MHMGRTVRLAETLGARLEVNWKPRTLPSRQLRMRKALSAADADGQDRLSAMLLRAEQRPSGACGVLSRPETILRSGLAGMAQSV